MNSNSMKASIQRLDDIVLVEIKGYLDFETAASIPASLDELFKIEDAGKIVIDLNGLEFVGSSGVSNFVKNLRVFNKLKNKPSYCFEKSEFQKLFRAFEQDQPFDISANREDAKTSALARYDEWQMTALRSKRTH